MLMAFWAVQRLTREINELETRAAKTRIKLTHYQKYADALGRSSVMTVYHTAGMSADLLPRATTFAQFSNQASTMDAMQRLQMAKMMGMVPWTGNPMSQMMFENSAFMKFKEESLKALKQQEAAAMNEIEKEIQLEMNTIEVRLKEKRAMLDSAKQLLSEEAKESAPRFGL